MSYAETLQERNAEYRAEMKAYEEECRAKWLAFVESIRKQEAKHEPV